MIASQWRRASLAIFREQLFWSRPCYILTAAHVVLGTGQMFKPGVDYTMNFAVGVGALDGFSGSVKAFPVWNLARMTPNEDWMLLKLEGKKCLGVHPKIGFFESAAEDILIGTRAVAVGYGYGPGRTRGTMSLGRGEVMREALGKWYHFSGSFVEGASVGPLLVIDNGLIKVAGLVTSQQDGEGTQHYPTFSEEHANNVQSLHRILSDPEVKEALDADKARFGNINPASERLKRPLPGLQPVGALT